MLGWTFFLRHEGQEIPLTEGDIVLGRSRGCGFRVDKESVSRSHALLSLHGDEVQVRDLGSSNGLFVNGKRVTKETVLKNGDSIGLGSAIVSFVAIPPPDVEAKTAMINIVRPSRSVTQFIQPQAELERAVRPLPPSRSAEDVVIRPEIEEPALPSRVTAAMTTPPGVLPRLLSGIVDLVIAAVIAGVCFAPALVAIVAHSSLQEKTAGGEPVFWALLIFCGVVAIAAVCVYFLATLAGRGATFGQRIFRIAVVTDEGETPKSGAVIARMLGLLLYVATAGLLFLPAAFNREGRGLADRISGTRVEKA